MIWRLTLTILIREQLLEYQPARLKQAVQHYDLAGAQRLGPEVLCYDLPELVLSEGYSLLLGFYYIGVLTFLPELAVVALLCLGVLFYLDPLAEEITLAVVTFPWPHVSVRVPLLPLPLHLPGLRTLPLVLQEEAVAADQAVLPRLPEVLRVGGEVVEAVLWGLR